MPENTRNSPELLPDLARHFTISCAVSVSSIYGDHDDDDDFRAIKFFFLVQHQRTAMVNGTDNDDDISCRFDQKQNKKNFETRGHTERFESSGIFFHTIFL